MQTTKVKDETVEGHKIEIYLTPSGKFFAAHAGDNYEAETLKALLEKLRNRVRAERAAIPVSWIDEGGWRDDPDEIVDGFLVGVHASHGNLLLRALDGKRGETRRYYGNKLCHRLTDEEKAKYRRLESEALTARKEFEDYRGSLEVDGYELLKNAAAAPPEEKPKRGRKG